MATSDEKSGWRKLFSKRTERSKKPSSEFDRYIRAVPARLREPPVRGAGTSTGIFIEEAIRASRFETAALTLATKGKPADAEQIGEQALQEGKYNQAIEIFSRVGNQMKLAIANEMAAAESLRKGGSKKLVASRMYAAIQAYGKTLGSRGPERIATMKKMTRICDELADILDEGDDNLGVADTCLYNAQLFYHLVPSAGTPEINAEDPEFFEGIEEKIRDRASRAKTYFRRHVDEKGLSPKDPEGQRIVEKLKTANKVLDLLGTLGQSRSP